MRISTFATVMLGVIVGTLSTSAGWNESGSDDARVLRADAIARAQVWTATEIPVVNIRTGPGGRRAFAFRETVTCDYVDKDLAGRSPKFACASAGDDLKIKFGSGNAEVCAEVAATRLLWTLGFGADRMYAVQQARAATDRVPGGRGPHGEHVYEADDDDQRCGADIWRRQPGERE